MGQVSGVNITEPDRGLVALLEFKVLEVKATHPLTSNIKLINARWNTSPVGGLMEYDFAEIMDVSLNIAPKVSPDQRLLLLLIACLMAGILAITILVVRKRKKLR